MTDREYEQRRYADLMDRESKGEPLTDEERAFCAQQVAEDPSCAREAALIAELADLDAAPTAASRALVDAALARLEREAVQAEREQISRFRGGFRVPRFAWALGAAAAIALGVGVALLPRESSAPKPVVSLSPKARIELVYASGEVRIDGRAVEASTKLLAEGSRIEVANGSACVAMDPGIDLCLGEHSQTVLSRMQNPWRRVDLLSGKAAVQLQPQPEGSRLSIVADGVWSTAVGTAFTVDQGGGAGVRTTVLHGKVRVGNEGAEQLVSEHQRAQVQKGSPTLQAISRGDEAPEWALLRPTKLWTNPVSATLEVQGLAGGSELLLDGQLIGHAPLSTVIPAGPHRLQARSEGRIVAERGFVSEAGERTVLSFVGEPVPASAPEPTVVPTETAVRAVGRGAAQRARVVAPAAKSAPSAAEMLSEARRLLRSERFDDAAESYRALRATHPESPEAHAVLLSLAELQLDRFAQPEQALESLELYLKAGRGSLMEEARQVRIRALRDLGRSNLEADAIEEFLREHPRSFKAAALSRRLQELQTL